MADWSENVECRAQHPYLGLALAAITAFSHGDELGVEAVMDEVSIHPLELFVAQTRLARHFS